MFGRDQRDGQYFAKLWRSLAYREPGVAVFGTRLHQVEHLAYAHLLAAGAGVRVPRFRKTGVAGPDAAFLITERVPGTSLAGLGDETPDSVLASAWEQLDRLHRAGVAHGRPRRDPPRRQRRSSLVLRPRRRVRRHRGVLAPTRRGVTPRIERAAGRDPTTRSRTRLAALGPEQLGAVIPYLQPATLPKGVTRGIKHLGKSLKELRANLTAATGVEDVPPLKVQRLTWMNIGMLAGVLVAVGLAITSLEGVDWHSIQSELENAIWAWALVRAAPVPAGTDRCGPPR